MEKPGSSWPPIPKIPRPPGARTLPEVAPFDVEYIKRLDELIARDAQFDQWIEELPEMMLAARKDETLRNIIESAYMMYCLKYKKE